MCGVLLSVCVCIYVSLVVSGSVCAYVFLGIFGVCVCVSSRVYVRACVCAYVFSVVIFMWVSTWFCKRLCVRMG